MWDASRTWRSTATRSPLTGCLVRSVQWTLKSVRAEPNTSHVSSINNPWDHIHCQPCAICYQDRECYCVEECIYYEECLFSVGVWKAVCKIEIWTAAYRFIIFAARLYIRVFILLSNRVSGHQFTDTSSNRSVIFWCVGPVIFCQYSKATDYACDWSGLQYEQASTLRKQMLSLWWCFNGINIISWFFVCLLDSKAFTRIITFTPTVLSLEHLKVVWLFCSHIHMPTSRILDLNWFNGSLPTVGHESTWFSSLCSPIILNTFSDLHSFLIHQDALCGC